jgi:hypothetical protein
MRCPYWRGLYYQGHGSVQLIMSSHVMYDGCGGNLKLSMHDASEGKDAKRQVRKLTKYLKSGYGL